MGAGRIVGCCVAAKVVMAVVVRSTYFRVGTRIRQVDHVHRPPQFLPYWENVHEFDPVAVGCGLVAWETGPLDFVHVAVEYKTASPRLGFVSVGYEMVNRTAQLS